MAKAKFLNGKPGITHKWELQSIEDLVAPIDALTVALDEAVKKYSSRALKGVERKARSVVIAAVNEVLESIMTGDDYVRCCFVLYAKDKPAVMIGLPTISRKSQWVEYCFSLDDCMDELLMAVNEGHNLELAKSLLSDFKRHANAIEKALKEGALQV